MRAALVALLVLAGCSGSGPDYVVDGLAVYVDSSAEWVRAPEFEEQLRAEVRHAREYWSLGELDGWQLSLVDGLTPCGSCGCARPEGRLLDVSVSQDVNGRALQGFPCSSLTHEIGHIRFPDPTHSDPLWRGVRARCR